MQRHRWLAELSLKCFSILEKVVRYDVRLKEFLVEPGHLVLIVTVARRKTREHRLFTFRANQEATTRVDDIAQGLELLVRNEFTDGVDIVTRTITRITDV